jgi:tRNA(Ile)-lysidine synthase
MALAWLLRRWGDPLAIVVDHGLRAESASEAALTMERLAGMGVDARLVRLDGLQKGPDMGARARTARYDALLAACRGAGRPDLFVAHHRQDLAETVLLRAAAGSGPAGRAAMAAVSWRHDARIVRPLLSVMPMRLRATLRTAGIGWVDDPGNTDPTTARGALRIHGVADGAADLAVRWGVVRGLLDRRTARELANRVAIYPTGHARVTGPLSGRAWSTLVWTLSGRPYPPRRAAIRTLVQAGEGTVHGVQVKAGLVVREAAAMAGPVAAAALWDGRFRVRGSSPGATLGGLGNDSGRLRRRPGLPSLVMKALPSLRLGTDLLAVPHLDYPDGETCLTVQVDFHPPRPLAGAPFGSV